MMVHQQSVAAAGQSAPTGTTTSTTAPGAWCPPAPDNWTYQHQMHHQHQRQHHMQHQQIEAPSTTTAEPGRKRKAESQDNERLSKRLSLLNLEQSGSKLYVPVETPSLDGGRPVPDNTAFAATSATSALTFDETMQLDNTKHKVYIYNLDDELSSEGESGGGSDDGTLVFLPDIDKHLRDTRIPPHVLASPEGELAGMQMVLYSDPRSLTVPEEQDGVRRAIIDARARVRERQRLDRMGGLVAPEAEAEMNLGSGAQVYDGDDDVMEMDMD